MSNIKDRNVEISGRNKILRRFAQRVESSGFTRSKTTIFTRPINDHIVEVIMVHKQSGWPEFQVYVTIQVLNAPLGFADLNGFHSHMYDRNQRPNGKKFNFAYHIAEETLNRCLQNLHEYMVEIVDPWFTQWRDTKDLIESPNTPLSPNSKKALERALNGDIDENAVRRTRQQLGLHWP